MAGECIACHASAYRLPVEPDSADAVDQDVVLYEDVDCCVELYAAHLGAAELHVGVDVVDVVVLDCGEYSAKVTNYAGLAAVVDMVVADLVGAYVVFVPAHVVGLEDGLQFSVEAYEFTLRHPAVMARGPVFSKAYANALGIADLVVLNHPAFAPVRAYQAFLECGGRSPLSGRLAEVETFDCYEVDTSQFGEEHCLAHIDFSQFLVGVCTAEIGVDNCLGVIHLHIPAEMLGGVLHFFCRTNLPERLPVEINLAQAQERSALIHPVSVKDFCIRIEISEITVGEGNLPYVSPLFACPGGDLV